MKEAYWRWYKYIGDNVNNKTIEIEVEVEIEIRG